MSLRIMASGGQLIDFDHWLSCDIENTSRLDEVPKVEHPEFSFQANLVLVL